MGSLGGEVDQTGDADRPDVLRKLARPENVDFTIDAKLQLTWGDVCGGVTCAVG